MHSRREGLVEWDSRELTVLMCVITVVLYSYDPTQFLAKYSISGCMLYVCVPGRGGCVYGGYSAMTLHPFHSDYLFKLLLIGDSGVGKSCLLLRFAVS